MSVKITKQCIAVLLSIFLVACGSNPMIVRNPDQTLLPPPADKAQIVFLNPSNSVAGAFLTGVYEVKGESKELYGMLNSKTKMVINVAPGKHLFMSHTPLSLAHFMDAEVDAGKRYYVLLRFIYGRGLQLRPIKPTGGSEFSADNPKFQEWKNGTSFVVKTAEADAWYAKYNDMVNKAQVNAWADWLAKSDSQKAELTLQREDFHQ